MDTKKLRLSSDRCYLLGPDGEVIRELLLSEHAGIGEYDSRFGQGYTDDHLEELLVSDEELERRRMAWREAHPEHEKCPF